MVNAKKVRDMVAKKSSQFVGSVSGNKMQPHKHCRICFQPIPLSSEPRVCKEQECINKNTQDEKNQRSVRIWMFVFFGLFAASFLVPLALRLIG
ncbi:MAG TPA: DUF2116 family Zn-ribbon domain-containing protein [Poseidonia sp.]|nr:DUF2116 family Zn-ribbon domain-containing protein [Poseidonia sp.]